MNKTIFAAALILLVAAVNFGQMNQTEKRCENANNKSSAVNSPQIANPLLAVPAAQNAWTIEIHTSGGLTGNGAGNFAITSEGNFALDKFDEQSKLASLDALQPLIESVKKSSFQNQTSVGKTINGGAGSTPSYCNDCITTTIRIHRREADGTIKTFSASWDDVTAGQVGEDFRRIYEQAIALKPSAPLQ